VFCLSKIRQEKGVIMQNELIAKVPSLHTTAQSILPCYKETGRLGLFQLKRMWHKAQLQKQGCADKKIIEGEWSLDVMIMDTLGLGLTPTIEFIFSSDSFLTFENWVEQRYGIAISNTVKSKLNEKVAAFFQQKDPKQQKILLNQPRHYVLTSQQWQSWDDNGYVIIPELVEKTLCENVCNMIYERLNMDKNNPASWYRNHDLKQGVMVQIFNDITMQAIRKQPQVRDVFEQLWGKSNLTVSTDRVGFNPPETLSWQFPGPNLHWDINFNKPLIFATQGLLYLTDVTADQGAFSCVPGFHKKIDGWLARLPKNTNPHHFNCQQWHSTPLPAKAGSLIVWQHTLPHGSCPNRTNSPRIVQYINMSSL
jgi:hypothetical protein